jgi:hypothetical protein
VSEVEKKKKKNEKRSLTTEKEGSEKVRVDGRRVKVRLGFRRGESKKSRKER